MSDDLAPFRQRIDSIDRELVRLLNERAACAQRIGEAKRQAGSHVYVPHREQEVFARLHQANEGPIPDRCLNAIWREIISTSYALEAPLSICHFGQPGAFTFQAARMKFGEGVRYAAIESIAGVFDEIERGRADYGIVPIENSTDGGITDTIDAFLQTRLHIVNELFLRVRHHLMGRAAQADIQRIYSKHTVFGQCRNWLSTHMPGIELIETGSTTQAAARAAEDPSSAAIGNAEAAHAFDLTMLASDIEDNPTNTTRFVVLADIAKAAEPSGDDKTSLMFGIQDRPGALYEALLPFYQAGISLSRIESRPNRREPWEYLFFIDLVGHRKDGPVTEAIEHLRGHTSILQILGSYPRAHRPLNDQDRHQPTTQGLSS